MSEESYFKDDKFLPSVLAKDIIAETNHLCTPMTKDGGDTVWHYHHDIGIYKPDGIPLIKQLTKQVLGNKATPHKINQVVELAKIDTYILREDFEEDPSVIVMENGVFHIETEEFRKHGPIYNAKSRIPVKFDPNAECPKIMRFLSEIVGEKDVPKLIELAGYCLFKSFPIARIVILVGEGDNGKSTYLELVGAFLGIENLSSISIQKLAQDGFRTAQLFGKLANICADVPSQTIKDTGILKLITGRDLITAEKKYQDPFQFINYAKPIFSANKVPAAWDNTRAFHRRMVIIPFPNIFDREDPKTDTNILEKITTPEELSGFFNEAMKGLKRFLTQKGFSHEATTEERKIEYMKRSNPVQYFATIYVEKAPSNSITKARLYDHYVHLCTLLNVTPIANTWFSRQVRRYLPYVYEGQDTHTRDKVWRGIRVKLEELETVETEETVSDLLLYLKTKTDLGNNKENAGSTVSIVDNKPRGVNPSLTIDLGKIHGQIRKAQKIADGPVNEDDFFKFVKAQGWHESHLEKLLGILERDKMIFRPRPGFLAITEGS